jgi:pyruvate ferredoxin oxidoreductase alpha subunit
VTERKLMTGNSAAAWGARLAQAEYVPSYPITPQTEIIETLSKWSREGVIRAKVVQVESEHSMLTAAGTASLTGARVFTATSSQGFLFALEMLYNISGWRAPFVLMNVSRGLAAPITLEPDHNDVLSARDSGFLQFHAENCQEILDLILLAYRVSEDKRVLLPSIVNLDGFYLSFTREPVNLPDQSSVRTFLPEYEPVNPFRASRPVAKGIPVFGGHLYSYFRYQTHGAALRALDVFREASEEFESEIGRKYEPVDGYMLDDADYVLVMSNSFTTIGKQAVKRLREKGFSAGLLKLRMLRPFPTSDVLAHLRGAKGVAVLDQNIAPGSGGIIYPEITAALYHEWDRPDCILPVVGGLGGKQLTMDEMEAIFHELKRAHLKGDKPKPMFLMREDELRAVKQGLRVAGVEKEVEAA